MGKKYFLLFVFYFILVYHFPFEIFPSVRYEPWEDDVTAATGKAGFCAGIGVERFGHSFAFRGKCREDILFLEALVFTGILTALTFEIQKIIPLVKKAVKPKSKRKVTRVT